MLQCNIPWWTLSRDVREQATVSTEGTGMSPLPKQQPETQVRLNIQNANKVMNEVRTITPQLAEVMLEHNIKNRPLRTSALKHCIRQLQDGNFQLTGDSITFSDTARLLNGQHRLLACVETGISFEASILYGVKEESFHVMDTGVKRSPSDVLSAHFDIKNAPQVAAMLRIIMMYNRPSSEDGKVASHFYSSKKPLLSKDFLDSYLTYGDDALQRSMLKAYHPAKQMGLPSPAYFGALHFIASKIDVQQADEFFHGLITNEMLTIDDPRYRAHQQIRSKMQHRSDLMAIIAQAWNRYRKGQSGRRMYKPEDGTPVLV